MFFIDLLAFLVAIGVIVFFVTQVALPFYQGTPFFPWLRGTPAHQKVVHIQEELAETEEEIQAKALQDELNRRKAQLKEPE